MMKEKNKLSNQFLELRNAFWLASSAEHSFLVLALKNESQANDYKKEENVPARRWSQKEMKREKLLVDLFFISFSCEP